MPNWSPADSSKWWSTAVKAPAQTWVNTGASGSYTSVAGKHVWVAKVPSTGAAAKTKVPSTGAASKTTEAEWKAQARNRKRIYQIKFMLKLREKVKAPADSPLSTLCMKPRPEEHNEQDDKFGTPRTHPTLRADAPEYEYHHLPAGDVNFALAMEGVVPEWPFPCWAPDGSADELSNMFEAPYWISDDPSICMMDQRGYFPGKVATRSPSSTICNSKTDSKADGSEEDVDSSTTVPSVPPSPGVLPAPFPKLPPVAESTAVREIKARGQIEYYFSAKNLSKDWYLRTCMDDEGWVSMDHIMNFPRTSQLNLTSKEAAAALLGSCVLEVTWESPPRVRLRDTDCRMAFPRFDPCPDPSMNPSFCDPGQWPVQAADIAGGASYFGFVGKGQHQMPIQGVAAPEDDQKQRKKQRPNQEGRAQQPQLQHKPPAAALKRKNVSPKNCGGWKSQATVQAVF